MLKVFEPKYTKYDFESYLAHCVMAYVARQTQISGLPDPHKYPMPFFEKPVPVKPSFVAEGMGGITLSEESIRYRRTRFVISETEFLIWIEAEDG